MCLILYFKILKRYQNNIIHSFSQLEMGKLNFARNGPDVEWPKYRPLALKLPKLLR